MDAQPLATRTAHRRETAAASGDRVSLLHGSKVTGAAVFPGLPPSCPACCLAEMEMCRCHRKTRRECHLNEKVHVVEKREEAEEQGWARPKLLPRPVDWPHLWPTEDTRWRGACGVRLGCRWGFLEPPCSSLPGPSPLFLILSVGGGKMGSPGSQSTWPSCVASPRAQCTLHSAEPWEIWVQVPAGVHSNPTSPVLGPKLPPRVSRPASGGRSAASSLLWPRAPCAPADWGQGRALGCMWRSCPSPAGLSLTSEAAHTHSHKPSSARSFP